MKNTHVLTLLVCAGLGLSMAAPAAKADSTTASSKIEAAKAKREAAIQQHATDKKAKIEENATKKEAKVDEMTTKKTEKLEQRAANKEATVQAHKDAVAAKQEILKKNRDAIKATKTTATTTAQ